MKQVKSCGFLIFRDTPRRAFLLMQHKDRLDLPKGHVDEGETDLQCALRELEEETGIAPSEIEIDPQFRHEEQYQATYKRFGDTPVLKTLVIFLGTLKVDRKIALTEHQGFEWVDWKPPHKIQAQTIDLLLAEVARHLRKRF